MEGGGDREGSTGARVGMEGTKGGASDRPQLAPSQLPCLPGHVVPAGPAAAPGRPCPHRHCRSQPRRQNPGQPAEPPARSQQPLVGGWGEEDGEEGQRQTAREEARGTRGRQRQRYREGARGTETGRYSRTDEGQE